MTRTKTLTLALVAALSLGAASAMAQEGPTVGTPNDWAATPTRPLVSPFAPSRTGMPQAGSSDTQVSPLNGSNGVDGVSGGGG